MEMIMTITENKTIVRRYFEEAFYNPEICDQIFAPQIPWHTINRAIHPNFISTPQDEKAAFARHQTLWGGWSEVIDEMIAEDDRVMVRWSFNGSHQGEYLGIPPTHNPVSFAGIYIFRIQDGRIAEVWNLWDQLGEWQQLGILPDTGELLTQAMGSVVNSISSSED